MKGLIHEADHVRECLIEGLTESPILSNKESINVAEILDFLKKELDVKFPEFLPRNNEHGYFDAVNDDN